MNEDKLKAWFDDTVAQSLKLEKLTRHAQPYQRPKRDRHLTISKFKALKDQVNISKDFQIDFVTSERHSSLIENINCLKSIQLDEMKVNKIHSGYFLRCRLVEDPFLDNAVHCLVEDQEKNIEYLDLFNLWEETGLGNCKINDFFTKDITILIKEPYLKLRKINQIGDDEFSIHCDSPTDLIIINESNRTLNEVVIKNLVDRGNEYFNIKRYHKAVSEYTKAINTKQVSSRAYLNRSAASLNLNYFKRAYDDAVIALKMAKSENHDRNIEKAYFRIGKASYKMKNYQIALNNYTECLKLNDLNKDAREELKKSLKRDKEQQSGQYDFKQLTKECLNGNINFDIADYKSDLIEVVNLTEMSKGVIALRKIKKGTLLACSQSCAFSHEDQMKKTFSMSVDFRSKKFNTQSHTQNLKNIIGKMRSNPKVARDVYSLYAGSEYNRDKPISPNIIDVQRVEAIQNFNSFQSESLLIQFSSLGKINRVAEAKNSGLWIFPSFFNHSCLPNTLRIFFGDIMFIYARRDLDENEELTVNYTGNEVAYQQRKEILNEMYGFECCCELCEFDKKDSARTNGLINMLDSEINQDYSDQNHMKRIINKILKLEDHFQNRPKNLRIGLIEPLKQLASFYKAKSCLSQAAKVYEDIYIRSKEINENTAFISLVEAYHLYMASMECDRAKRCYEMAAEIFPVKIYFETLFNIIINKLEVACK